MFEMSHGCASEDEADKEQTCRHSGVTSRVCDAVARLILDSAVSHQLLVSAKP